MFYRIARMLVFYPLLLLYSTVSLSHTPVALEALKAAYVYNIARFVHWPAGAENLTICVLSENEQLVEQFQTLAGKRTVDRVIQIFRVAEPLEPESLVACNIFYSDNKHHQIVSMANNTSEILTISEEGTPDWPASMIVFYIADHKLHFDVNLELIHEKKIDMSSKLLRLSNQKRQ